MAEPIFIATLANGREFYSFRTRLEGSEYNFAFQWNIRQERWYMTLADAENVNIVASVCVVCDFDLLRYSHHDERCPPGGLIAIDLTGGNSPPGLKELGVDKRVRLTYFPVDEA